MKQKSALTILIVVLAALDASIALAHAHAFPTLCNPRVGSTVTTPPSQVQIAFDAPVENLFAKVEVLNGGGENVTNGPPAVSDNHREVSIPLKQIGPGVYTVKWSVVAKDGHRSEGSYSFTVAPAS